MGKVLIPQEIAREGVEALIGAGHEIRMGTGLSEKELMAEAADCDAILLRTAAVTRRVLEAGTKLKIVARHGAGYNNVDIKAAEELGIWVTNTPDATTGSVAEFTIGAILSAARRMFEMNRAMKAGDFFYKNTHKGTDLAGKTLAVIGLGRIGLAVARKAYFGLDMKIIGFAHNKEQKDVPEYIRLTDWETAFREADFVTLHVPLRESTRGFVGTREFDWMKPSAYLINCARGEVVREQELITALNQGQIAGAFCDVLEQEPPASDNPLLAMPSVSVTPHMASNTEECMAKMAYQAALQVNKVLAGLEPDWPVNHPAGR